MKAKKFKLYWDAYQTTDLLHFKSADNTWENTLSKGTVDHTIYFDANAVPDGCSLFLVEPKSIHPFQYDYALKHSKRLKYIMSYDKDTFKHLNNFIHIPPPFGAWIDATDRQVYTKSKNISAIASTKRLCPEHIFRQKIVNDFTYAFDVFGRGRGEREIHKKLDGLADYRFSLCMENYVADLYYTEKLLDCFLTGTIPIFYGSRKIADVFDERGIVWLDDVLKGTVSWNKLDQTYYESRLESVNINFNIAKQINNNVSNSLDVAVRSMN